ncbi:yippee-like protein [Podospora australis]|uniref:Yippee-like protein n=1 Tax=Podospora australis TaxID=1536484 RepID=A0AAN7AGT8_9PEZI|nr:yippee-like protein [Podospora australis]
MFTALISTARPPPPLPVDDGKPKFPQYLLPTIRLGLRRNRTRTRPPSQSDIPSLSTSPSSSISSSHIEITQPDTLRCLNCRSDLAFSTQIISKGFHGRHGRALLVSPPPSSSSSSSLSGVIPHYSRKKKGTKNLINIRLGPNETRQLVTGSHVVADIFCSICDSKLGWKYVDAKAPDQKYKVGKFILETAKITVEKHWEDVVPHRSRSSGSRKRANNSDVRGAGGGEDEEVVFDLNDEDECDDMFAGVWDPEVVARRREERVVRQG